MIERLARLPVDVDYASEYRYRNPIPDRNALGLLITQSGETADTLAAQREMIALGSKTVAICNVVDAMVAREAHGAIYTHAGPEIGVASTKAFTAQLTALFLLALKLGQLRGQLDQAQSVDADRGAEPHSRQDRGGAALAAPRSASNWPRNFPTARDFLYLGRGIHFPIALEGALKLKEISYIHAEGYPAGEMKHGPNALIDETLPVVVLATRDESDPASKLRYEKTLSNIQEVTARSRPRDRRGHRGRHDHRRPGGARHPHSAGHRAALAADRDCAACNCWPTTSPSAAAATWTSPETWPSRSPWSRVLASKGYRGTYQCLTKQYDTDKYVTDGEASDSTIRGTDKKFSACKSSFHGFGTAGDYGQIRPRGAVGTAAALFPVLQGARIEHKTACKLSPAEPGDRAHGPHIDIQLKRELVHSRRLQFALGYFGSLAHGLDKFF